MRDRPALLVSSGRFAGHKSDRQTDRVGHHGCEYPSGCVVIPNVGDLKNEEQ